MFSVRFWPESVKKYARIRPLSVFFTTVLQIVPVFFSTGQEQLLRRAGQKNTGPGISPRISPLHDFWIAELDGTALFDLVDTV